MTENLTHDVLYGQCDEEFFATWLSIVGEPPAIVLDRDVMIDLLFETVARADLRGSAEAGVALEQAA